MNDLKLHSNVTKEVVNPLTPDQEVYWVSSANQSQRIVQTSRESVNDQEIEWSQARITEFREVQRTLVQRLFRSQVEDTFTHPNGKEMQKHSSARKGFLVSATTDADLVSELHKRIDGSSATIIPISDTKAFLEGVVPVTIHQDRAAAAPKEHANEILTTSAIEAIYRKAFADLPIILAKRSEQFSHEEALRLHEIDTFRQQRVRWASIDYTGGMITQESGKIGDAWIFVVPPDNAVMQKQASMLSMNIDSTGLNPYLSILPYNISTKWASLGAIHELSHLRDAVLGIEPRENRTDEEYVAGEHRAYKVEQSLAFAYSNQQLQPTLHNIVRNAMQTANPLQALGQIINEKLPFITQSIDQCIDPAPAKSSGELGIRQGLYMMLLGFEAARQLAKGDAQLQEKLEKQFIELVYGSTGHLPEV